MPLKAVETGSAIDFAKYPPVGVEDWSYGYVTAVVGVLEGMMLSGNVLTDIANAVDFASAVELLSSSEYAFSANSTFEQVEQQLLERRTELRDLFAELMPDERYVHLLRAREDFANMRLAVRRVVTEKPIGTDYSQQGSVPADEFEEIFEQEDYYQFPDYLQDAVEAAVLGYYKAKDIREIDYNIDRVQFEFKIKNAHELGSVFLESLFRTQVDLTNIRTMLRLKSADRDEKGHFFDGGFVERIYFEQGLSAGYDSVAQSFFATPYSHIVEEGVRYLNSNGSFLLLEKLCQEYLMGFLKTAFSVTAGHQPVCAYLLLKENEIRSLRMLLTAKKNQMDKSIILDRLAVL